ncbi:hypothetical protein PO909_005806 [Leuciscus waleckii]
MGGQSVRMGFGDNKMRLLSTIRSQTPAFQRRGFHLQGAKEQRSSRPLHRGDEFTGERSRRNGPASRQAHSKLLFKLVKHLLIWAHHNLRSLRAAHVPGKLNQGADMLSRSNVPSESMLHPHMVHTIWETFGKAEVDLFASEDNSHCPTYFSKSKDVLAHDWPSLLLYAFPPIALIPQELLDKGRTHAQGLCGSHSSVPRPCGWPNRGQKQPCGLFHEGVQEAEPVPTWDLSTVLRALMSPPFETLQSVDLRPLTLKTILLLALALVKHRHTIVDPALGLYVTIFVGRVKRDKATGKI